MKAAKAVGIGGVEAGGIVASTKRHGGAVVAIAMLRRYSRYAEAPTASHGHRHQHWDWDRHTPPVAQVFLDLLERLAYPSSDTSPNRGKVLQRGHGGAATGGRCCE